MVGKEREDDKERFDKENDWPERKEKGAGEEMVGKQRKREGRADKDAEFAQTRKECVGK